MAEHDKLTETRIFEAATEVFTEKGMDGARMQDIADRAGINQSLLHYYFRTKDRLFNAVFEKVAGEMIRRFSPVLDEHLSLEEKIRFFYSNHLELLKQNPRLPGFLLNEINRHPDRLRKLMTGLDIKGLWDTLEEQHRAEFEQYGITHDHIPQLMSTIVAISVFPFAAKGLFSAILEKMGYDFNDYIEKRKQYAADFVMSALKKNRTENRLKP
jgi:AcrR family transcriptional regulator